MIAICDKTGIKFEASSKRQKNHPLVSQLLNGAAKDKHNGAYAAAMTALDEVKTTGGYTIEEAIAYVESAMQGNAQRSSAKRQAEAERDRQMREEALERKARRDALNARLRQNGYRWSKDFADFDEYEEGEPSVWNLYSSDNRLVSVEQAIDEIERGAAVVLAEIANSQAAQTAVRRREDADRQQLADAITLAEQGEEVESFDDGDFDTIYERRSYTPSTMIEIVKVGKINGVSCGTVYRYYGASEVDSKRYYSQDASLADLVLVSMLEGVGKTLMDFFA